MAAEVPDIGTGATIEFATSLIELECTDIQFPELSIAVINTTHLATAVAAGTQQHSGTAIPGRRRVVAPFTVRFHWDPAAAVLLGVAQTITITSPDGTTLIGTGFASKVKGPNLVDETLQEGELEITPSAVGWDLVEA